MVWNRNILDLFRVSSVALIFNLATYRHVPATITFIYMSFYKVCIVIQTPVQLTSGAIGMMGQQNVGLCEYSMIPVLCMERLRVLFWSL